MAHLNQLRQTGNIGANALADSHQHKMFQGGLGGGALQRQLQWGDV